MISTDDDENEKNKESEEINENEFKQIQYAETLYMEKIINNICKMNDRNEFIANIINSFRQIDKRKILILSRRVDHLKVLKKLIDEMIKKDINNGKCTENDFLTLLYIGETMNHEKKNLIQSIGRITRKSSAKKNINPLILDIIDEISYFKNWGDKRIKYYESQKFNISNYNTLKNNLIKKYSEAKYPFEYFTIDVLTIHFKSPMIIQLEEDDSDKKGSDLVIEIEI